MRAQQAAALANPEPSDFEDDVTIPYPSGTTRASGVQIRGIEVRYVTNAHAFKAMVEVWTRAHIYYFDASFELVWVLSRASVVGGPPQRLAGARLCGGEVRNEKDEIAAVYLPVPVPQSVAVFERRGPDGVAVKRTSPVERVVFRVHEVREAAVR